MTRVVQRLGHTIKGDMIHYRERCVPWTKADKIAKQRLDRRRNYTIISGQVCSLIQWSGHCSGCSDDFCGDRGAGCRECGFTGRRKSGYWMPHDGSEPR